MPEQIKSEVGAYFNVEGFATGKDGLEGVKSLQPSLVLCDVMLPDMNDNDIVKQLKADETTKSIPVIMLTALDDERHQTAEMMHVGRTKDSGTERPVTQQNHHSRPHA